MLYFWILIICIPIFDQIIKFWIRSNITPVNEFWLVKNLLKITNIKNSGAAFGSFSGKQILLISVFIFITVLIFHLIFNKKMNGICFLIGFAFIIGGGAGNIIDRISLGFVTDYIQISIFPAIFNIADGFITAGALILILKILPKKFTL